MINDFKVIPQLRSVKSPRIEHYICPKCLSKVDVAAKANIEYSVAIDGDATSVRISEPDLDVYCTDCEEFMFKCDELFVERIITLNKLGLKTRFCCQGHIAESPIFKSVPKDYTPKDQSELMDGPDFVVPYISFIMPDSADEKKFVAISRLLFEYNKYRIEVKIFDGDDKKNNIISVYPADCIFTPCFDEEFHIKDKTLADEYLVKARIALFDFVRSMIDVLSGLEYSINE